MSFFSTLRVKPWLADQNASNSTPSEMIPGNTALKFLMAVISVFFMLLIITFLSRTQFGDFQALAGEPWLPLENNSQLRINTGIILLSSVCFEWAYRQKHDLKQLALISVGTLFSVFFLLGQVQVWQQLSAAGYLINNNPANSFFYLLTALHALHLLGGGVALARLFVRLTRHKDKQTFHRGLNLVRKYWHFLFVLWLVLFSLLTSSTETFTTIAKLCGF